MIMGFSEHLALGLNTTLIGMGIVFLVLIALWLIVVLEHHAVSYFDSRAHKEQPSGTKAVPGGNPAVLPRKDRSGQSRGISTIEGVGDDETLAVILAAVSEYTEIPLNELKIAAVRAVE